MSRMQGINPSRNVLALAAVGLFSGLIAAQAFGGLNAWSRSWTKGSDDGRFLLVMIAPVTTGEELESLSSSRSLDAEQTLREVAAIRARYSQRGLYRNDGSTQPLWTMSFQSEFFEAFVAPDGRHVVLTSTSWRDTYGDVISFYDRGSLLESYGIDELVRAMPSMKWRVRVRPLAPSANVAFDVKVMTCTLKTSSDEIFHFDMTTGKVIGSSSPWPLYFASAIGFPVLTVAALLLAIAWFRVRRGGGLRWTVITDHGPS